MHACAVQPPTINGPNILNFSALHIVVSILSNLSLFNGVLFTHPIELLVAALVRQPQFLAILERLRGSGRPSPSILLAFSLNNFSKRTCFGLVINYTNPVARNTMAINRYTQLKAVGLCHGIGDAIGHLSKILGVKYGDLDVKAAGINHFIWIMDLRLKSTGEDAYPTLREKSLNSLLKIPNGNWLIFSSKNLVIIPLLETQRSVNMSPMHGRLLGLTCRLRISK